VQSIDNPQFNKQVNWELDNLSRSDIAFFYFDPKTKSPITLMELGFMLGQSMQGGWYEIIVVCPDGFWRQGNVEIMCARAVVADGTRVSYVTELDAGISILRDDIERQLERAI
jgi:hypothetical protein